VPYAEAIAPRLGCARSIRYFVVVCPGELPASDKELAPDDEKPTMPHNSSTGVTLLDRALRRGDCRFFGAIELDKKNCAAYADRALAFIYSDKDHARADIQAAAASIPSKPYAAGARCARENESKWLERLTPLRIAGAEPRNSFAQVTAIALSQIKRDTSLATPRLRSRRNPAVRLHTIRSDIFVKRHSREAAKEAQPSIPRTIPTPDQAADRCACQRRTEGFACWTRLSRSSPTRRLHQSRQSKAANDGTPGSRTSTPRSS